LGGTIRYPAEADCRRSAGGGRHAAIPVWARGANTRLPAFEMNAAIMTETQVRQEAPSHA